MKKNQKQGRNGNGQALPSIRLEFSDPTAQQVAIAGTFNDWRPDATQMIPVGDGRWRKELVLPPGTYEYLFVVDGHWIQDPLAKTTSPNPFGGVNSVIAVPVQAQDNGPDKLPA